MGTIRITLQPYWHVTSCLLVRSASFQASVAMYMRYELFRDVSQRIVVILYQFSVFDTV